MLTPGEPVVTRSPEETRALGRAFAAQLPRGICVALRAPLGGGKTCFVQGVCAGFGVQGRVTSPTFILVNEYEGGHADGQPVAIYHFDLYRLSGPDELDDLGWNDYVSGDGVCLVEWADRAPDLMPDDALWIDLEAESETDRRLTLQTNRPDDTESVE